MANIPRVLYSNVLRDATTTTYSQTAASGFEEANATDWLDWTLFRTISGSTDLDFTMGASTDIDSFSLYTKTHSTSNTIALKYESSVSSFTTLHTYTATSGKLTLDDFASVTVDSGRRIRVSFTGGSVDVRQLWAGEYLDMQRGQWDSATSPILTQGVKVTNNISVNGSFLGRSIKRLERAGKLQLDHLTQDWVRDTWEPFAQHCTKKPFIYRWHDDAYNDEIGFCFAEKISAPQNAGNSFMSVDMPIRMLVADENQVT